MDPQKPIDNMSTSKARTSAKDFFLNLGAIVALYTTVVSLINLLFTVINKAWPQVSYGYNSYGSQNISWQVATLIIFFPVYLLLMWLLERGYDNEPEKRNLGIRRWLTYITLFIAGLTAAIDLVTVIYYFIDGQELTTGFLLKVLTVLIVALGVFMYYIYDVMGKLNGRSRKIWAAGAFIVILAGIVWGFAVLGSPRSQQMLRYDETKVSDLENLNSWVSSYYQQKGSIPDSLDQVAQMNYTTIPKDPQSGKAYEYHMLGQSAKAYQLCAEFNAPTPDATSPNIYMRPIGYVSWEHPAGHYCFELSIPANEYFPVPTKK